MCTHVWQIFWKISSNSEHHSKPTMNINLQHHNLLGNQISPKSEDFCILVAILYLGYHGNGRHFEFFQPPQKLPHTTVDIPTKFDERNPKSWQLWQSLSNRFRFFWLISFHLMWMLLLSSFINFRSASNLLWSFLCFSIFYHFGRFHDNGGHFET